MQYYKIDLLIGITFLSKEKYISRSFVYAILCDQKLLITIFREEKKPKSIMLTVYCKLNKVDLGLYKKKIVSLHFC